MRMAFWLATAVVAVACGLFAASNRQPIRLGLWPFPFLVDAPLYLLVFFLLLVGFAVGLAAAWIGGRRRRRELRHCRRRSATLERELAAARSRLDSETRTVSGNVSALGRG